MGLCNLVERRNGIYIFRKRVPEDLQEILGKKTIKQSLGTSDPIKAKEVKASVEAAVLARFNELRLKLEYSNQLPTSKKSHPRKLSPANPDISSGMRDKPLLPINDLQHIGNMLAVMDEQYVRSSPYYINPEIIWKFRRIMHDRLTKPPEVRRVYDIILDVFDGALKTGNYDKDKVISLLDQVRYNSSNSSTGIESNNATVKGKSVTIVEIIDKWAEDKRRGERNQAKADVAIISQRRKIEAFIKSQGNKLIGEITVDNLIAFRDDLANSTDLKAKTINGYLASVHAIITFAVNNRYIESHPLKGINYQLKEDDSERREPFDKADLELLFLNVSYKALKTNKPERFWIPLIALFTGARIEEIAQLKVEDIKEIEDIFYIDINEKDGKHLKNKSSIRKVPIHPVLLELRLIEFIQSHNNPKSFVFEDLKAVDARRAHSVSNWFSKYKVQAGITDSGKVFHSFRHTLIDACRAAGIAEDMHEQIAGHARGGVHRNYGSGHHIKHIYPELCKVSYGLDFNQLNDINT